LYPDETVLLVNNNGIENKMMPIEIGIILIKLIKYNDE